MRRVSTVFGELKCQVLDGGEEGQAPALGVVLCHGFGAPAEDLVSLAPELSHLHPVLGTRVRYCFPGAPLSLADQGSPTGRAWWPLAADVLMGRKRDWARYSESLPEGLAPSRRMLGAAVESFARASGLPLGRIVLGGFSQGAMLATDLALRLEEPPAGLAILSGSLLAKAEWTKRAPQRAGLPVFQSHGRGDGVLPFSLAEQLRDLLTTAGLKVKFAPFGGQHAIPPETLTGLASFLRERLG